MGSLIILIPDQDKGWNLSNYSVYDGILPSTQCKMEFGLITQCKMESGLITQCKKEFGLLTQCKMEFGLITQ